MIEASSAVVQHRCAGAGVAEVMAYLNGVHMPKVGRPATCPAQRSSMSKSVQKRRNILQSSVFERRVTLCVLTPLADPLQIFNLKTLVVKFVSCAAAVGVGLPVGPEGPMIHMGALVTNLSNCCHLHCDGHRIVVCWRL